MCGFGPALRRLAQLGSLWSLLATNALAAAQDVRPEAKTTAAEPAYIHREEVAVLNAQFPTLLHPPGETAPNPADLIQLSRLLAEPCDQLHWLLSQAQAWATQPPHRRVAAQIAQAAIQRGQNLTDAGLLKECSDALPALQELTRRLESANEFTDPDALRRRLEQSDGLVDLDPYAKFKLLARGAPTAKLFSGSAAEDWDAPRSIMDRLAAAIDVPAFGELCDLQQRLATTYGLWTEQAVPSFSTPAQRHTATATFQIAAAFLDRALGLDRDDRAALKPPIPYTDSPAEWADLAAAFDQDTLRIWATLARILAASPPPGNAASPDAVGPARDAWADVRKVSADVWPAVDNAENGWLVRLADAQRLNPPHMLPLSQTFSAGLSAQRRQHENDVVTVLRGARDPKDEAQADRLLAAIQSAKIAELGLTTDIKPVDLKALKTDLGGDADNWVYLLVEMIELSLGTVQDGQRFAGVALYRTEYTKRTGDSRYSDRYAVKILPLCASYEEVVRAALAAPGPPLVAGGQIRKDARILLAPDGALSASWFAFERQTLLQPLEWTSGDASWVVYLPSVAMLGSSRWFLDDTLRSWYRSAARTEHALPWLAADTTPLDTARSPGPPLVSRFLKFPIFRVWMDKASVRPEEQLFDFMSAKRESTLRAIPLWVGRGPSAKS